MTLINTTGQSEEAITGDTVGAISADRARAELFVNFGRQDTTHCIQQFVNGPELAHDFGPWDRLVL